MNRLHVWPVALVLLGLLVTPTLSAGAAVTPPYVPSDACPEPNDTLANACQLGQPDATGTTVQGRFDGPSDVDVYRFEVPAPGAMAHISLTDLWYDGRLRLFDASSGNLIADSARQGQAQGQFRAPEVIARTLEPGSYAAFVLPGQDDWEAAEAFSYTLRVALGPRPAIAGASVPYPTQARGYQLTLSIEPNDPSIFSLMTFTATIDPPFTDLFDFSLMVDGQPLGDEAKVVQLGRPLNGPHTVQVVARGARYYPDLSYPELPPTLGASGAFIVR